MLAVEKLVQSKLLVPGSNKRIGTVDRHMGIVSLPTSGKESKMRTEFGLTLAYCRPAPV